MENHLTEVVAELLLQLGLILIIAKLVGEIFFRYFKMPPVLGELVAGIAISPFALGGIAIPAFDLGFISFPGISPIFELPHDAEGAPVELPLYFVAQIGAVILLFEAGLETNRKRFVQNFGRASLIALGGLILPFILGAATTVAFGFANFSSLEDFIPAMFVGVAMTATSVGITARVLGDLGQIGSAEGISVLAAAVVDDVLGIVLLSITVALGMSGTISVGEVANILIRAAVFLFIVLVLGSLAANRISRTILSMRSATIALGLSLSIALITSAIAELYFLMAVIIGAYSVGLALSETKLREEIEKPVHHISAFVSPLFFAVIGMQVNFGALASTSSSIWLVIGFIVVLSLAAVVGKVAGSGVPALFTGFNRLGATRIGVGMMPRGEVALIVAGIGISSQIIDETIFVVVVVMTVVTTILAPSWLTYLFKNGKSGVIKKQNGGQNPPREIT